jgi:hypothetical protein
LMRWVMLAYELAVLKARGHMDTEEGKSYLVSLSSVYFVWIFLFCRFA